MFSLKPLIYTVVFVVPILIFLYLFIRKKREIGYWDVVLIAGIVWVSGFAITIGFGDIIFMVIAYARKMIDYLV